MLADVALVAEFAANASVIAPGRGCQVWLPSLATSRPQVTA